MERNLRRYPWLHLGQSTLLWLPVFVLYFSAHLPPDQVLRLEALYYLAVVLLEVPSGYLSDRIGRRWTLLASALGWASGAAVLAASTTFAGFAVGQVFLAVGMSFFSGTDSALLYDTLAALDRTDELTERQGRAQAVGLATLAGSALVGGVLAGVDLRWAYGLSAAGALIGVWAALGMVEPPRARAHAPARQVVAVLARLGDPVLRWTFAFAVAMTVLNHIPYELFQPWLAHLFAALDRPGYAATPPAAGVVMAGTMALGAVAAANAARIQRALGAKKALLAGTALQAGVIGAMAWAIHPVVVPMLLLRSVPAGLAGPILAAVAHPRLGPEVRATYLSVQSLAGRLAFSGALALASLAVGPADGWTVAAMDAVLVPAAAVAAVLLVAMTALPPRRLTTRAPRVR